MKGGRRAPSPAEEARTLAPWYIQMNEQAECQPTPPPHPWDGIPRRQWEDWRWQLTHRLNTAEDFARVLRLTPQEITGLSNPQAFRVDVTPYFASLLDPDDPACPLRRQVLPTARELESFAAASADPLSEAAQSPVPGLVHRYPDRVLMLLTTQCASYCRFCTRSRIVGNPHENFSAADLDRQVAYIAATPQIRDVLLSGGDALLLPDHLLHSLLTRLRAIAHVEVIRISTRVPIFLPQRITAALVEMLRLFHPLWINIHCNHPQELAPEVEQALARLADAGIPLGSQSVLMAGINDCPQIMLALVHALVKNRVRPYYLYQCDLVTGAGHFRTPVARGLEIMEALRGHTSGYAVPVYVLDMPQGGGKVPLAPTYLLSQSESRVVVRNYEGYISAYTQPEEYQSHRAEHCAYCQRARTSGAEHGIAGLLAGHQTSLAPQGWQHQHQHGASTP